jgi:hypothetical protein
MMMWSVQDPKDREKMKPTRRGENGGDEAR